MHILEQLNILGLNGRQAKVYLALLQLGSGTAIEIAKHTKLKHPTVYDVLDILKEKHLVSESMVGKRKIFRPEDPETLSETENRRQSALGSILPTLKDLYQSGDRRPSVYYYEGFEGVVALQEQLLNVKTKEYFYFGSVQGMFDVSSEKQEEEYVRKRIRRGIWSYSIRDKAREVSMEYMSPGKQNLREVRYFPKKMDETISGLYIFDNKIAIASGLKENYTIIIESSELFILLKTLWQYMWEISDECS